MHDRRWGARTFRSVIGGQEAPAPVRPTKSSFLMQSGLLGQYPYQRHLPSSVMPIPPGMQII